MLLAGLRSDHGRRSSACRSGDCGPPRPTSPENPAPSLAIGELHDPIALRRVSPRFMRNARVSWCPSVSAASWSALQRQLILPVEPGHGSLRGQFGAGVVGGHLCGSPAPGDLEGSDSLSRGHQVTGHPDPG